MIDYNEKIKDIQRKREAAYQLFKMADLVRDEARVAYDEAVYAVIKTRAVEEIT